MHRISCLAHRCRALGALTALLVIVCIVASTAGASDEPGLEAEPAPEDASEPEATPGAEPEPKADPLGRLPPRDRFVLRGGYQWIFGANTTVRFDGEQTGIGATIEWRRTLGGEGSSGSGRFEAYGRFLTNHAFEYQWFRAVFNGVRLLEADLQIGDEVFVAGADIISQQRIDVHRFVYSWSFYRSKRVELELSPGLYIADTRFEFTGTVSDDSSGSGGTTLGDTTESITAPLPSLGIKGRYAISDWLEFRGRADFFYFKIGDYEGSFSEFTFGPEVRLREHVGLGLVYDRLNISVQDRSRGGWRFDNGFNSLYAYGAVYF